MRTRTYIQGFRGRIYSEGALYIFRMSTKKGKGQAMFIMWLIPKVFSTKRPLSVPSPSASSQARHMPHAPMTSVISLSNPAMKKLP